MRTNYLGIFLVLITFSCKPYRTLNRFSQVTEIKHLSENDTLSISEVIICSTYRTGGGMEQRDTFLQVNKDSLLEMYTTALKKTGVPFKIEGAEFLDCKAPMTRAQIVNWMLDSDTLKNISARYPEGYHLLPFIGVIKWDFEAQLTRHCYLSFHIYMIKDGELVFSRAKSYVAPDLFIYAEDLPETNITQENWNELVRRLFEDYKEILQEQNQLSTIKN